MATHPQHSQPGLAAPHQTAAELRRIPAPRLGGGIPQRLAGGERGGPEGVRPALAHPRPDPGHHQVHLLRTSAGIPDAGRARGTAGLADMGRGVGNSPETPRPRMDTQDNPGMPPAEGGRVRKTVGRIRGQPTGHRARPDDSKSPGDRPREQRQGRGPAGRPTLARVSSGDPGIPEDPDWNDSTPSYLYPQRRRSA